MANNHEKDDALFEQLNQHRKKKRRKTVVTVLFLVAAALTAIGITVSSLRTRVQERFAAAAADVKTYQASVGRISTTVSGSGVLASVGSEQISLPKGVEADEILVSAGDVLKAGDAIATVKMASVMSALSDTQDALDKLENQLNSAKNDSVGNYITSGITGRVKVIYAQPDQNVVDCMTENGALAILSLDGCMVVKVDTSLTVRDTVRVVVESGKEYTGTVETSGTAGSTVTLTDDGPKYGETVTILDSTGAAIGTGTLEIHSPLAVTGYAGTVSQVNVRENQKVSKGSNLFRLTDTKYSANYDALMQTRTQTEETLQELITMLRTGSVTAPFDGTVSSVDFESEGTSATAAAAAAYLGTRTASDSALVTMAPDTQVSVTIAVDETDILALQLGQKAEITVSSVSEEPISGEVTEITRTGASYSGVTQYSAVVTLDKQPGMLAGMTATVDIQIQGVEDVVLIPVDALHQTSRTSFVYTSYDSETRQYGGRVDVVSGVQNSNFVEIVSGLNPGDTVYYTEKNTFNFFNMPGMGGSRNNRRGN